MIYNRWSVPQFWWVVFQLDTYMFDSAAKKWPRKIVWLYKIFFSASANTDIPSRQHLPRHMMWTQRESAKHKLTSVNSNWQLCKTAKYLDLRKYVYAQLCIWTPSNIYLQKHHVPLVFQLSSSSPAVKASLHSATVKDPTSNFSKFPTTSLVSHIFQPRLLLLVFSSYVSCISQIFLPRLQWPTSRNLWKIKSSCTHVCNLLWVIFCPFLILCILMRAIKDVSKDK